MLHVSVTETLKNRSRALLAKANGSVNGADGGGGGPSGSARLARPAVTAAKKVAYSCVSAKRGAPNDDCANMAARNGSNWLA